MANLTETVTWEEGIYQWEEDDPVVGGPSGIDNVPTRQLANRTAWLKAQILALADATQPVSARLTALAALVLSANQVPYATGANTWAATGLTEFARSLLGSASAAAARATLGAAPLASPEFTGTPTAPTASGASNSTQIATTAFVQAAVASLVNSAPGALDTLHELAAALGNDPNFATTVTTALAGKAPLVSPGFSGTPTAPTATAGTSTAQLATTAFVQDAVNNSGTVAQVAFFARSTAPTGWLKANGAAVSRTTYAALFSAIGTTFGAGNGSTTFNLPDLRGEFPRGWDDGRGVDVGRTLGSAQASQNIAHTHGGTTSTNGSHVHEYVASNFQGSPTRQTSSDSITHGTRETSAAGDHNHSFTTSSSGGTEARPRNVALLACIKF